MSLDDPEVRKKIFRKTAATAIENSHGAIKQVWVVLFAGGTFALINSFDTLMGCAGLFTPQWDRCKHFIAPGKLESWCNILLLWSLYLVYLLTFYRFYVGNIRVFDMRYIEVVKFIDLLGQQQPPAARDAEYAKFLTYTDRIPRVESIILIVKTLMIISLTIEINTPEIFLTIYLFVLVLDVIWIFFAGRPQPYFRDLFIRELRLCEGAHSAEEQLWRRGVVDQLKKMFPVTAMKVWKRNNIACAALLAIIGISLLCGNNIPLLRYVPGGEFCLLAAGAAVMLANCAVDLICTWRFYNPQFADTYALFPPARTDSAPTQENGT